MEKKPLISLRNISKTFSGNKVLDSVNLDIYPGEVHALIGENGAGKSTLLNILSGVYQPDEGAEIIIEDKMYHSMDPAKSLKCGISVIYQGISMFPNLSVAENIRLSHNIKDKKHFLSYKETQKKAQEDLERIGVSLPLTEPAGELSVAQQQMIAIAHAFSYDAKVVVMDEPTSTLSNSETERLFELVNKIKETGVAFIFVSHKLSELFAISQTMTVLRDGKLIATKPRSELDQEKLIELMVGRKVEYTKYPARVGKEPVLDVRNISKKGNYKNISFTVHAGEILTITGMVGSGRTELLQTLFGMNKPDSGTIVYRGKEGIFKNTEEAVKNGFGFVPEHRQKEGILMSKDVEENIIITQIDKLSGIKANADRAKIVADSIQRLDIRPPRPDMLAKSLSGGNQQKVVLAKWMASDVKVLLIDEPTNGIDVGAKTDIHRLLREMGEQGAAVIMVSSDFQEVLSISDRIIVMRKGEIVQTLDGNEYDTEALMNVAYFG